MYVSITLIRFLLQLFCFNRDAYALAGSCFIYTHSEPFWALPQKCSLATEEGARGILCCRRYTQAILCHNESVERGASELKGGS